MNIFDKIDKVLDKIDKPVCIAVAVFDAMLVLMACANKVNEHFKEEPVTTSIVTTAETTVTGTSAVVTSRATTVGVTTSVTNSTTTSETTVTEPSSEVYVETVEEPIYVEYHYDVPVVEKPVETVEWIPSVTTELGLISPVSDTERSYLIHVVHHEAGNQSYFAKKAECSTVLNRCKMKCMNVLGVLTEPNQYPMDYSELYYCEECAEAVDDVLTNGVNIPEDVIYAFATYCNSSWLWSREIYCIDGDCVFAR